MLIDSEKLEAASRRLPNSSKTMVVRNGRVIWQGDAVNSPHSVFSITKTFASTGLRLLVDDGTLSLDSKVADYNPALAKDYSDVTFDSPIILIL